jgi:hypothetical protein
MRQLCSPYFESILDISEVDAEFGLSHDLNFRATPLNQNELASLRELVVGYINSYVAIGGLIRFELGNKVSQSGGTSCSDFERIALFI